MIFLCYNQSLIPNYLYNSISAQLFYLLNNYFLNYLFNHYH